MGRHRRTQNEVATLKEFLLRLCADLRPLTIRSLFYRAVSAGVVEKDEKEYKTIQRLTRQMRRDRELPYSWLVDAGRAVRSVSTWDGPASILRAARESYRRDKWQDQPIHLEIWVEKDAVVGIIEEVTSRWQVPLYSGKGYGSLSIIYAATQAWPTDRDVVIRYFGDRDPSGVDAARALRENIYEIHGELVDFEICAVTEEQVEQYSLPTRPTKRTDSRAAGWAGESVELDAFHPDTLRDLVEQSITAELDDALWVKATKQEEQDDQALGEAVDTLLAREEL